MLNSSSYIEFSFFFLLVTVLLRLLGMLLWGLITHVCRRARTLVVDYRLTVATAKKEMNNTHTNVCFVS